MEYKIMLRLSAKPERHDIGFGRGIMQLLEGVARTGSLNAIAHEMGMSYSKAWRLIKQTEAEFDLNLLERDGPRGSSLTQDALILMGRYNEILEAANNAARGVFAKYYPGA